jgi:8-oxo-dGTP diphosphatase
MSGKIVNGKLNLSNEHEGYAWVFFDDLPDYELADWLHDFVINQSTANRQVLEESEDKISSKEALKPYITPIKSSMDKILRKK